MRIVAISDTHARHRELDVPDGDVLVHAGDITRHGDPREVEDFDAFLAELPHAHKIVIAGNHDFCFESDPEASRALLANATYLQDEAVTVDGVRFYGSPWQPAFMDWAFNLDRGPEIRAVWEKIPEDTDVLVTHGPPHGHGDRTRGGRVVGCRDLLEVVRRIRPRLHVFGHIHEGAGRTEEDGITFLNASSLSVDYRATNRALVFELE